MKIKSLETKQLLDKELKKVTNYLDTQTFPDSIAFIVIAVSEKGFSHAVDERIPDEMVVEICTLLKNSKQN